MQLQVVAQMYYILPGVLNKGYITFHYSTNSISRVLSKTYIEFSTFLNFVSHTYVLNTNVLLSLHSV